MTDIPLSAEKFDETFGPAPNEITHVMSSSGSPILKKTIIKRHPSSARFHELLAAAGRLHDQKQDDYGRERDPFSNVRASEEWGIDGWVGSMVRLNDKVRRLQKLATSGSLSNESALDSMMDIAVYALIAYVLYEEEHVDDLLDMPVEGV